MMSNNHVKVAEINTSNKQSFGNVYNNKMLKSTFKFAEENGALFVASTSLLFSGIVRPLVVMATPDTDKKNKQYAASKSIASSLTGFAVMFLASVPLSKSIKKIDTQPIKYLKKETIKNLQETNKDLKNSKPYIFATQLLKLGLATIIAAPKAMLTCAIIPFVMSKTFKDKQNNQKPTFKGHIKQDFLAKKLGQIIDSPKIKNLSDKFKDSNYEMALISATDILATAGFIHQNNKNKEMNPQHKKALNYNVVIGTGLSIGGAYTIDKALNNKTQNFIDKFKCANPKLENIEKYAEGIKITKKVMILGSLYYGVIPLLATFFSDKISKKKA